MKSPWQYAEGGSEHAHQVALFMWAAMAERFGLLQANDPESYTLAGYAKRNYEERGGPLVPELKWLHAIKNQGHGDAIRGAKSAAEGVKAGVFDVFLPVPNAFLGKPPFDGLGCWNDEREIGFGGLYLELKKPKSGRPSPEQLEFQSFAREAGYAAEICYGWEEARDTILRYLGRL